MNFGLGDNIIAKINDVFERIPQVNKVIIFGSRATGSYKNRSDIDLSLIGENLNLSTLSQIDQKLDDLLLPYTFDILIYDHIDNQDLIEHIQKSGKEFYVRMRDS
jgi:predicted nucleotidyltransferase